MSKTESFQKLLGKTQSRAGVQFYEGKSDIIQSQSSWYFQNKLQHWLLFILDTQGKVYPFVFVSFQTLDVFYRSVNADNDVDNSRL